MAKPKGSPSPTSLSEQYAQALTAKSRELRAGMAAQNAEEVLGQGSRVLREVEEALGRLSSGTFGVCQECDEPISGKRLAAVPWARHCLTCQELVAERHAVGETLPEEED